MGTGAKKAHNSRSFNAAATGSSYSESAPNPSRSAPVSSNSRRQSRTDFPV